MIWGSNPGVSEIFAPVQTGPGAYPASHEIATGSYLAVKRPVCGLDHHLLFSAVVKERVGLILIPLCTFMAGCRLNFAFSLSSDPL